MWGNRIAPAPLRGLLGRAAPSHTLPAGGLFPGRAAPSHTLPPGRGVGKPGFPNPQPPLGAPGIPVNRSEGNPGFPICSHQSSMRLRRTTPEYICSWEGCALPHPPRWRVVSWEGYALPHPPAREGRGETWFPQPPTVIGGARRPAGRGLGNPGFPVCSHQRQMDAPGCLEQIDLEQARPELAGHEEPPAGGIPGNAVEHFGWRGAILGWRHQRAQGA